jgi:hypothetical protein
MKRLAIVALLATSLQAQTVEVRKTADPIRIDAVLDEPAWVEATPMPLSWEWFPGDNIPAAVKTEALVTWSDDTLYVAFRAFDPRPGQIRARYAERDAVLTDDTVSFLVDPFNDDRRAYQFRINPLGVQADAINSDVEGTEDFLWDGIWESAGRLTGDGYVVEVAVPLQQLRTPTAPAPQTWGFMAQRDWPRDVRHRFRSVVTDQNRNCLICQLGDVTGFGSAARGPQVEVTPTITAASGEGVELGASGRWAITSGSSLAAMLNPDFSQVEADAEQLDVNTRFALSFSEKRPFFLEGADFFETRLPLVYTRTIGDPVAGLKFTGKTDADTYAILLTRDRITNFLLPSAEFSSGKSIEEPSTTAVGRYRHEFGANATAGGIITSRTGPGYSNTVASGDSFFRLTEQDSIRVQVAGSQTDYPEVLGQPQGSIDGHGLLASYDHADRDWTWSAVYEEYAPGFRADVGLFNQVGVRFGDVNAERRIRGGPDRWFSNLYIGGGIDSTREYDGLWTEWGGDINVIYQGPRETTVEINVAPNQEYFAGRTYHNFRQSVFMATQLSRDVYTELSVSWGESIDFSNARAADFITISPAAVFNIGRRISGRLTYSRQIFDTQQGRRIFALDLPQARLLYHFSGRSFLRAIVQYRDVARDQEQYNLPVEERERGLLSQLLFSYRINAQTVFLLGYSDNYAGDAIDLTQTDRAVFLKLGYAWLF